jgi:hypothetical protein
MNEQVIGVQEYVLYFEDAQSKEHSLSVMLGLLVVMFVHHLSHEKNATV